MALINCKSNVFPSWSEKCTAVTRDYGDNVNNKPKLEISDTKPCSSCEFFKSL